MLQLSWFVQVRWAFVCAQLAVILASAYIFPEHFPTASLLALLLMTAVSNIALRYCVRCAGTLYETVVPATLLFDITMFCLILALSGGHANPFCSLLLIHITLAAVLMNARWMWATLTLSAALYGSLFMLPVTLPEVSLHPQHGGASLHLVGMLVSFLLTAIILGIFLGRLTSQLAAQRKRAARLGEIAAVGRLVANTAHELASPLNTVVLALESLCAPHSLARLSPEAREDTLLAHTELRRAYQLLKEMPKRAGVTPGEAAQMFDISELSDELVACGATHVQLSALIAAPRSGLLSALKNLITNSRKAKAASIRVTSVVDRKYVSITVLDDGEGLPHNVRGEELLAPFVGFQQTLLSDQGLGLGLFIVATLAEDLGGNFSIQNRQDTTGAIAVLRLARRPI